jgi:hypothetical protein
VGKKFQRKKCIGKRSFVVQISMYKWQLSKRITFWNFTCIVWHIVLSLNKNLLYIFCMYIIWWFLKFYNLNLPLKLEYVFIIICFEVETLSKSKLGFKNLFEELATWFEFDLNSFLHLHNGHASWPRLNGGLLGFVYVI